jgi:dienelactone hydrolase
MKRAPFAALTGAVFLLAVAATAGTPLAPGPQGAEGGASRQQLWLLPIPGERLLMHATVMRPAGPGPFPLAVINHGSIQSADVREKYGMPEYPIASQWFLDRGYAVVLPQRPGHGATGGPYFEDQGLCESPDYRQAGLRTADSIEAAIDYMTAQPFVRRSGVVVVGQSAGGWGALALASRNPRTVTAVVNFAGGRGGRSDNKPDNNCAPGRLVAAAGDFGRTARIPTLWIYSENDIYFAPALSKRLGEAFRDAGGNVEYHLLPPLGADGHLLINSAAAAALWVPIIAQFLADRD